jgi:hypothetical protein
MPDNERLPEREEFGLWCEGEFLVHTVGTVQLGWRGYTRSGDMYKEPPTLAPDLQAWLEANPDVTFTDRWIGPPAFKFATPQAAEKFRIEWHEPGLISQRHYLTWCWRTSPTGVLRDEREEMEAAWEAAQQARRDFVAARKENAA